LMTNITLRRVQNVKSLFMQCSRTICDINHLTSKYCPGCPALKHPGSIILGLLDQVPTPYPLPRVVNIAQAKVVLLDEVQLLTDMLQEVLPLVMILKHTRHMQLVRCDSISVI
jgi:hypothetical protein